MVLGFAGYPLIWAAVLADAGTCLLVILNSMMLLHDEREAVCACYRASPSSCTPSLLKLEEDGKKGFRSGIVTEEQSEETIVTRVAALVVVVALRTINKSENVLLIQNYRGMFIYVTCFQTRDTLSWAIVVLLVTLVYSKSGLMFKDYHLI